MDSKLLKFYEDQFTMFASPGWAEFMEDVKRALEPLEDISTVTDAHQLHNRQGQIKSLKWVLNRKVAHEQAWKMLEADEEADSA